MISRLLHRGVGVKRAMPFAVCPHPVTAGRSSSCSCHAASPFLGTQQLKKWVDQDAVTVLDCRGRVETSSDEHGEANSSYITCRDAYLEGHIPVRAHSRDPCALYYDLLMRVCAMNSQSQACIMHVPAVGANALLSHRVCSHGQYMHAIHRLQGAVFWDWQQDGIDTSQEVPVQLQQHAETFGTAAAEKGVSADKPVVCYDWGQDTANMFACRVRWALRQHGHPEVYVLEGGWHAWLEAGGATTLHEPCPLESWADFEAQPQLDQYADLSAVQSAVAAGDTQIVDARSAAQYKGEVKRAKHGGHMPGAVSVPYSSLMQEGSGMFKPAEELQRVFDQAGVQVESGGLVYCNGGVSACVVLTALEALGAQGWRMYDGSWNEYGNLQDPALA